MTKFANIEITDGWIITFRDSATSIYSPSSGTLTISAPSVNLLATITPVNLTTSWNTILWNDSTDTTTVNWTLTANNWIQAAAYDAIATSTWATTGIIPAGTTFASVTTANIAYIVVLPTPVLWNIIYIKEVGTTWFEIKPQANTQFINWTECTVAKTLAMAWSTWVAVFTCVVGWAAGKWVQYRIDDDGSIDAGWTPN